jgi:hypothetical protein
MSPGLAKRVSPSQSTSEIHSSTPSPNSTKSSSTTNTIETVVLNSSKAAKSPTMTNSVTSSSSSSSMTNQQQGANSANANLKIQNALEKNMQKLNSLPGRKTGTSINMTNLSKEDIELFTQSATHQQQMSQQYYQHAYNFACDSLQSTPEHQMYHANQMAANFNPQQIDNSILMRSPHMMQQQQQLHQHYLMNQQQQQQEQYMPDSTSYYLNGSGSSHMLVAAAPIQPYFIQNDLNNSKNKSGPSGNVPVTQKTQAQLLRNAASITEREMTPDSIDENVNELVLNTKKVRLLLLISCIL